MAIGYQDGGLVVTPEDCPDCETPLYDSGCAAPRCPGVGCQDCGWGCDLDFDDQGRCAQALDEEHVPARAERVDAERAAFGLPPASEASR